MAEASAPTWQQWVSSGEQLRLPHLPGSIQVRTFRNAPAQAPWLTLLHGYPTSSWDYAALIELLREDYQLLSFDLIGFGASAKPSGHAYSLLEQADLVQALWAYVGIQRTHLLAHDYGSSVATELLARRAFGYVNHGSATKQRVPEQTQILSATFLNSGLLPEVIHPTWGQRLLMSPIGPAVARLMPGRIFLRQLASVFASEPSPFELEQHLAAIRHRSQPGDIGQGALGPLARYQKERWVHRERWRSVLEQPTVPLAFCWGELDPVSGEVGRELQSLLHTGIAEGETLWTNLPSIGHYPQCEAPQKVAAAVRERIESANDR